jgi:TolA-binding protein
MRRIIPMRRRAGGLALIAWAIATALCLDGCAPGARVARTTAPSSPSVKNAPTADSTTKNAGAAASRDTSSKRLSPASDLLIKACDNYLVLNPDNPKSADVMTIKASLYYNNRLYPKSRAVYRRMIEKFPKSGTAAEATRMIAQGYYEEKQYDSAQEWYRNLSAMGGEGVNKNEAIDRIGESMFRKAEQFEAQQKFTDAAESYQRIAMEFPDSKIADVALFNASLCYEKQVEWSHVILTLQQLIQRYTASALLPKAMFRIGKANEKLMKWEIAADAYLRMVAQFPKSDLAQTALYNAGFSFENAGKLPEAAATFEKMIQLFPSSDDAADILFRAGELYGKLKNWEAVTRVNKLFTARFGNDANRVVQAQCMVGIALYMQNKEDGAVEQLKGVIATFARIKEPSAVNAYYAAKAQFTIGEITHTRMNRIALTLPRAVYQKQLTEKSGLLDQAVESYSRVVKFNISEWTTRAVCQIGQAYEDFAIGIFKQERPANLAVSERLALELGIAQAVEKYLVEKALHYYEQNVKLGIKEKLDDKNVLQSRQKLTYLPYIAGENYLALAAIANTAEGVQKLDGFALIARKLEVLQKIAPFQERATDLFLKCLEEGSTYQAIDEFYKKASASITKISCTVAETYADVVAIVIDAPIPPNLDDYERFVYKTKLLKQVESYETQAMTSYLKTLKIAEAYTLDDDNVKRAREGLARVLFTSGRCKDLLCIEAFSYPPFPKGASETEKEEYRARFEEIGLKFQEQAFEVYKSILKFAVQKYVAGPFVTHAYVRLFQSSPNDYGTPVERISDTAILSGPQWKSHADSTAADWYALDFKDSAWTAAKVGGNPPAPGSSGFPGKPPLPLFAADSSPGAPQFFRRTFSLSGAPSAAALFLTADGTPYPFVNGQPLPIDSAAAAGAAAKAISWDLAGKLKNGKNVIAIKVAPKNAAATLSPLLQLKLVHTEYSAKPPATDAPLPSDQVRADVYKFPPLKNFDHAQGATAP